MIFKQKITLIVFVVIILSITLSACSSMREDPDPNTPTPESLFKSVDGSIEVNCVESIRSADDKHVYIQARTYDDKWSLFRSTYDLKSSKRVAVGGAFYSLSPSKRYLLVDSSHSYDTALANKYQEINMLSVIDTKKNDKSILDKIVDKTAGHSIRDFGWCSNDNAFWYTDYKNETYYCNIKTKDTEKLFKGRGLSWSNDGIYFLYSQTRGDKPFVYLMLYDAKSKISEELIRENIVNVKQYNSSDSKSYYANIQIGDIENAIFNNDGKLIYYGMLSENRSDGGGYDVTATIKSITFDDRKTDVIWERSITEEESPFSYGTVELGRLISGPNRNEILFHFYYQVNDKSKKGSGEPANVSSELLRLNASNKSQEKIVSVLNEEWDYIEKTKTLLWFDGRTVREMIMD